MKKAYILYTKGVYHLLKNKDLALTIKERYDVIKRSNKVNDENHLALDQWRKEMSIISQAQFKYMLETNNYDLVYFSHAVDKNPSEELRPLLKEKAVQLDWYKKFNYMVSLVERSNQEIYLTGFHNVLKPFILFIKEKLGDLKNNNLELIDEELITNLENQFVELLSKIAAKPFVLEMNLYKEKHTLEGDTSEERYENYCRKYDKLDNLLHFYNHYIVLTRVLTNQTSYFITNLNVLVNRLKLHKAELQSTFKIINFKLKGIQLGQGDTHGKGNTVTQIVFKDDKKVIYKPKNLQIVYKYNKLVNLLSKEKGIDLKTYKGLYFDNYSFEEFIEYKGCNNYNEIKSFYYRYGNLLAIMHFINANDLHFENLIAHGEYPYIVDLETTFQNPIEFDSNELFEAISMERFNHVTSTLLLPVHNWAKKNREDVVDIDVSALDGKASTVKRKVLQVVNNNTDEMRYDYEEIDQSSESNNIPFIESDTNPIEVDYKQYLNDIIEGFQTAYQKISNLDSEYVEVELLNFKNNELVRNVYRDTSQYFNIINHSYHPDMLANMLDREKVFENMWSYPIKHKVIIKNEVEDMLRGDIPIFFHNLQNNESLNSTYETMGEVHKDKPSELVLDKYRQSSEEEMMKQISLINISIGNYPTKGNDRVPFNLSNQDDHFVSISSSIGDSMLGDALRVKDQLTWMTVNQLGDKWEVSQATNDFYDGLLGVYMFYRSLYTKTRNEKYHQVSNELVNLSREMNTPANLGLVGNALGAIHVAGISKEIFNDGYFKALFRDQFDLLEKFNVNSVEDLEDIHDYINGFPSIINSLIKLYNHSQDMTYLTLAFVYAEKYIKTYDVENNGLKYGFHGPSSVAFVFHKLGAVSRNKRYSQFACNIRGISDKRIVELLENEHPVFTWCNGILGTLLAEMEISQINEEYSSEHLKELEDKFVNSFYELSDDGLCHGNVSFSEYFIKKYEHSGTEQYLNQARLLIDNLISRTKEQGFRLRSTEGFRSIGLFTGLSGIGYQLLRVNDPDNIPSAII